MQTTWLHLGSAIEMTWLALGGPFLSFLALTELDTSGSPCRASISSVQGPFSATAGWHFLRDLDFVNWWVSL